MLEHIYEEATEKFWKMLEGNRDRLRHIMGTDVIIERLAMITDYYFPAMVQHQKVFPKYKDIYKGKEVVITATGPTFEYYHPMEDCIHIALSNAIFRKDIKYDYLFLLDNVEPWFFEKAIADRDDLIKFLGFNSARPPISEYYGETGKTEVFYAEAYDMGMNGTEFYKTRKSIYHPDLSVAPLRFYLSSIHCAFQFALWTHPDKIYLVGADCRGRSHARGLCYDKSKNVSPDFDFRGLVKTWREAKEFAENYYPDIEIISLNPVGLKGLFKDEYTEEYRAAKR